MFKIFSKKEIMEMVILTVVVHLIMLILAFFVALGFDYEEKNRKQEISENLYTDKNTGYVNRLILY